MGAGSYGPGFAPQRFTTSHTAGRRRGRADDRGRALVPRLLLPEGGARRRGGSPATARSRWSARRVGVCDVSTLGKIDMQGADAARVPRLRLHQHLLDAPRRPRPLRPHAARGRLRHGRRHHRAPGRRPLRRDDDHGSRRCSSCSTWTSPIRAYGPNSTCTLSVTEQWAQFAVAGPHSRDVLRKIVDPPHDISNAAFPFMAAAR